MIYFLLCRTGDHTIRNSYLYTFPGVPERVRVVTYDQALRQPLLPIGCYVFTDLERVRPVQMPAVRGLYENLRTLEPAVRLLNDPSRAMMRYPLLRTLRERGINDFDIYRVSEERRPERYPVFLRREDDHDGPISPLIPDRPALDAAIDRAIGMGHPRERLLITEYCDVRDGTGLVRKFGAACVAGVVVPRHMVFSPNWVIKGPDLENSASLVPVDEQIRQEADYIASNPHADQVRRVFEIAGIDYGRIDYGIKDGAIRVWEINTNPVISAPRNLDGGLRHRTVVEPGVRKLAEAILALDTTPSLRTGSQHRRRSG
jgi:hypothetical protein